MSATTAVDTDPLIGDIEQFLCSMIGQLEPEPRAHGRGRPRILPALALWGGLLVCVLKGFTSQAALWRLLVFSGLWSFPRMAISDEAVYKRLEHGGTQPLQQLFEQVRDVLAQRLQPYALPNLAPFASEVVALDGTTLDKVARTLPALRQVPDKDDRLLPGKLAGLFDLRRQQWRRVSYLPDPLQHDAVMAREMVQGLPLGSLILADLGYFGFAWFDWLTDQGHHWVSRLKSKISYTTLHVLYECGDVFDAIVFLGAYRSDKAAHAVRLVQFTVGQKTYRYITNVLDPQLLSMGQIAQLYARRWDIELAIKLVKRHLKLHLLWSAKTVVIQQQVWAVLIISQILQALRLEIAGKAQVDPYEVSMQLLVEYAPQLAANGQDPVQAIVERGRSAHLIRPSRRTTIQVPTIPPEEIDPLPANLVLWREPRYAHRNSHPRRAQRAN
jgi:hypothetical protein